MIACYLVFIDALPMYMEHYLRMLSLSFPSIGITLSEGIFFVLLAILLLSAFKELVQWIALKSLRSRKAFIVFIAYLLFNLFRLFYASYRWLSAPLIVGFPNSSVSRELLVVCA